MRGRYPAGTEYIDKLDGSTEAKERLKAILDTLGGAARLQEACERLALGDTRFHQLRQTALQAALAALEPRPAGRPSGAAMPEANEVHALQQRVRQLEQALHVAQVREEIALVFPHLRRRHDTTAPDRGKKTRPQTVKRRKPR